MNANIEIKCPICGSTELTKGVRFDIGHGGVLKPSHWGKVIKHWGFSADGAVKTVSYRCNGCNYLMDFVESNS